MKRLLFSLLLVMSAGNAQNVVVVDRDDIEIRADAVIRIPKDAVIADTNGNGVLHIVADDVTVQFESGSVLRGAPDDTPGDQLVGTGITIKGHKNVKLHGLRVRGYKIGLFAESAQGLHVRDALFKGNYRARLGSTPEREDARDWLSPHANDQGEWAARYGASVRILNSNDIVLEDVVAREAQNGFLLERVNNSKVFDCDASFLSGWGLALWRSSDNVISRNAFDFCIRGYSHGVYNRGQDSAGILMFEQCQRNVLADNSATHGGDGLFAFAGEEALNSDQALGNNDNLIIGNDFSYAAAHGLELTFSFGNRILGNQLNYNAICGIWGGYSQRTLIAGNAIDGNGDRGYGLERGGINIEHGYRNEIRSNTFRGNRAGVHLWWDADEGLMKKPWAKANEKRCTENLILANVFVGDAVAIHLRDAERTGVSQNTISGDGKSLLLEGTSTVEEAGGKDLSFKPPEYPVFGKTRPVGKRSHLAGRENIIMTEWGPWDHQSPLLLALGGEGNHHRYGVKRLREPLRITLSGDNVSLSRSGQGESTVLSVTTAVPGFHPYQLLVTDRNGRSLRHDGALENVPFDVTVFPCPEDPRENEDAWLRAAEAKDALRTKTIGLDLNYGGGGPSDVALGDDVKNAKLPKDHFGTLAVATIPLSAGTYKIETLSDDGIRVKVDGVTVIDDWTWHGPTQHDTSFTLPEATTVTLRVEHFELNGHAVLSVKLKPAP